MSKTIAFEGPGGRPQQVDAAHPLPVEASVVATAQTVAKATAAAPTYVEGDTEAPLSVDLAGGLRITGTINATSALHSTAAAPSYSEGTDNAFSSNLAGDLRVIAKQSGTWVIGAGSNLIGSTSIDQTTPGTTNAVDATNFPDTIDVNSGNKSNNTLRVVLATDQPALTNKLLVTPDLPSGASTSAKQDTIITALGSPFQAGGSIGNTSFAATQSGTWTVQPGNTPNTAPWLVGHGKTIKTAPISAITVDTDVVAAVSTKRIKVIAYALFTTGTSASTLAFKSNGAGGTLLANVMLQSQASAIFGANLAVPAPSFLFATAAGEKLTLDVGNTDPITGFITYFDDDAT